MPMDFDQWCLRWVTGSNITAGTNVIFCPTLPGKQQPPCKEGKSDFRNETLEL